MGIAAFRKAFLYSNPERYRIFLKNNLVVLNPRYYGVSAWKAITTADGPMFAINIVQDIDNPDFEPIAEVIINREYLYLWRDHCWTIAVNESNNLLITPSCPDIMFEFTDNPPPRNKTIVIHKIGHLTV